MVWYHYDMILLCSYIIICCPNCGWHYDSLTSLRFDINVHDIIIVLTSLRLTSIKSWHHHGLMSLSSDTISEHLRQRPQVDIPRPASQCWARATLPWLHQAIQRKGGDEQTPNESKLTTTRIVFERILHCAHEDKMDAKYTLWRNNRCRRMNVEEQKIR